MNTFDALNLIALGRAVKPSGESNLSFVARWYSKTFHTPLHVVINDLPIEDIWLAFFEERYQGMPRGELQEYIDLALETPEERNARIAAEEAEEAGNRAFEEMSAKASQKPVVTAPVTNPASLLSQVPGLPETKAEALPERLEPDIEMTFVDSSEMERLLDGGIGDTPKKPKPDPMSFR